jgi:hypothetical protein
LHTTISPFVVYFPVWNRALMHSNESAARVVLISSVRVRFECPHDDDDDNAVRATCTCDSDYHLMT